MHDHKLGVMQCLPWLGIKLFYEVALAGKANFPEVMPLELRGIGSGGCIDGYGRGLDFVIGEKVAQDACLELDCGGCRPAISRKRSVKRSWLVVPYRHEWRGLIAVLAQIVVPNGVSLATDYDKITIAWKLGLQHLIHVVRNKIQFA